MTKQKFSHSLLQTPISAQKKSLNALRLWHWIHNSTFILILVLAFALRFWKLGQIPFSLYWDEMAMYVDIKSILQTGHDMFGRPWFQVIYPSYGDYKLPVLIWLATLSAKFFGLSEWSLRLPSALAGLGTVVVAGLLSRELLKKDDVESTQQLDQKNRLHLVQLFTMAVVAFSPWSIMFSRTAFEGHLGQFLLALSLLCLFASRRRPWLLLLVPIWGAVATYAYFSVRFVWIGAFGLCAALMWWKSKPFQKKFEWQKQLQWATKNVAFPLVAFSLLLIPMLRSPLYKDANTFRLGTDSILKNDKQVIQSNIYREMAGNSRFDRIIFHRLWLTTQELLKNYSDNMSLNFLFVSGDPNLRHGTGQHGVFVLPLLVAFLIGVYTFGERDKEVLFVLFGWWMLALLPASVPENTPHALRSLNALVPLAIVIGVGLARVWEWMTAQVRKKNSRASLGLIYFLLVLFSTLSFFYHYFTVYPKESAKDWQNGYKQLSLELVPLAETEKVYVLPFDDRFYLWMMGYGRNTGQDFQSWQSKEYKFEQSIPNIIFHAPNIDEIGSSDHVVIAGESAQIEKFISELKVQKIAEQVIHGDDQVARFTVAVVKK
jgi:4-amino-4-deoxy-L-arabinose transferase-like glycosyltransferase